MLYVHVYVHTHTDTKATHTEAMAKKTIQDHWTSFECPTHVHPSLIISSGSFSLQTRDGNLTVAAAAPSAHMQGWVWGTQSQGSPRPGVNRTRGYLPQLPHPGEHFS